MGVNYAIFSKGLFHRQGVIMSFINKFVQSVFIGSIVSSMMMSSAQADSNRFRLDADSLARKARGLDPEVVEMAVDAYRDAYKMGHVRKPYLVVIDYSQPSHEERMWVFDLKKQKVLYNIHVTHGVNSGNRMATRFSNRVGSLQTSLGTYVTQNIYYGKHGYSLRLDGLEPGINDNAKQRGIVIHGASYASEDFIDRNGKLGRSWGCPAVDPKLNGKLISLLQNGSVIFSYYPDKMWLASLGYSDSDA